MSHIWWEIGEEINYQEPGEPGEGSIGSPGIMLA